MEDLAARNVGLVASAFDAIGRGDAEALAELFTPDAVWHTQRRGAMSGDKVGLQAIGAFFAETMQRTGGTFRSTPIDVMGSEHRVAVYARTTASRDGEELDDLQVLLCTVEGQRIADIRHFVGDPLAAERFWS